MASPISSSLSLAKKLVVKHNLRGVTNMKQSLTLLQHMKRFGTVTLFKFNRDRLTQERTGMLLVTYQHADDAAKAMAQANQYVQGLPAPYNAIEVSAYRAPSQKPQKQKRIKASTGTTSFDKLL
ncbi:hypothetical protein GGI07_003938 [Coemansia sp. Benny D115]|nr:hypothetical protein GGI07_003938 [Coemansia sp. Benny D115]